LDPSFFSSEIGENWLRIFYDPICVSIGLDQKADVESRDTLCSLLLREGENPQELFKKTRTAIQGNECAVFGAGPSLEEDLRGLQDYILVKHPVIVAADGAADALYQAGVAPDVMVSDLDSCTFQSLEKCSKKGVVFVHAHGDNIDLVRAIVPKLALNKIGTTQVETRPPAYNFGGFTDGDRACYVTSFFNPTRVVISGMDFGVEEGKFSVNRHGRPRNPRRPLKLEWGKKSLEFLIENAPTRFVNVTLRGVDIKGARKIPYAEVI